VTRQVPELSARAAAKIAAYGYLAIFVLAIFANFFVLERLIEQGDAAATAANIADSETLFRFALVAFLAVVLLDILIAWALYLFFRATSPEVSLLAAWFRLAHAILMGGALVFFFVVLELVGGADYLGALPADQRDAQASLFLEGFNTLWLVGLAAFGVHLALLGFLVLRSTAIPRILGVLLFIAGAAYVIDTVAHGLLAGYDDYETVFLVLVVVPSVVGELAFAVWLLLRGGKEAGRAPLAAERPAAST
jgi:hypothetical protein